MPNLLNWKQIIRWVTLVALVVYTTARQWLHLEDLSGDPLRTMLDAYRICNGELIYRDFTCQYPPLPTWLLGMSMAQFGATFLTVQVFYLVVGILVAGSFILLIRSALPSHLRYLASLLVVLLFSTESNVMALFTMQNYTVSMPVGFLFFNVYLLLLLIWLKKSLTTGQYLLFCGCSTGAFLSKPEFALAILVSLALVLFRGRSRQVVTDGTKPHVFMPTVLLISIAVVPAIIIYTVIGYVVGFRELFAGVTGYYVAQRIIPIIPTGYGAVDILYDAVRGSGAVCGLLGVAALIHKRFRRAAVYIAISAMSLAIFIFLTTKVLMPGTGWKEMVQISLNVFSYNGTVTWFSVFATIYIVWQVIWKRTVLISLPTQLIIVVIFAFQIRGLFQTHLSGIPDGSFAGIPYLQILGVKGLHRALVFFSRKLSQIDGTENLEGLQRDEVKLGFATLAVIVFMLAAFKFYLFEKMLRYSPLQWVQTRAGIVAIEYPDEAVEAYRHVEAHTRPRDFVADFTYGQVCFPGHLRSPMFSTQFQLLCPKPWMQQRDLQGVMAHPPRLVILPVPLRDAIFSGTNRYVLRSKVFVWKPDRLFRDDSVTFPAIDWLQERYTKTKYFPRLDREGGSHDDVLTNHMPRSVYEPSQNHQGATPVRLFEGDTQTVQTVP